MNQPSQAVNDLRIYDIERVWMVRDALDRIDACAPVESVLDCACNVGYWLDACHRRFPAARLIGIDSDANNVRRAKTLRPGIEFHHGDARAILRHRDDQYDAVLCMGMLYYFHDFESILGILASRCSIGMLVDTFCVSDEEPAGIVELGNPKNNWTSAAGDDATVRIPSIRALVDVLASLGFHARRIDQYVGRYDQSVGARLGHPLQRVGLLAVRLENPKSPDKSWSGWASRAG